MKFKNKTKTLPAKQNKVCIRQLFKLLEGSLNFIKFQDLTKLQISKIFYIQCVNLVRKRIINYKRSTTYPKKIPISFLNNLGKEGHWYKNIMWLILSLCNMKIVYYLSLIILIWQMQCFMLNYLFIIEEKAEISQDLA